MPDTYTDSQTFRRIVVHSLSCIPVLLLTWGCHQASTPGSGTQSENAEKIQYAKGFELFRTGEGWLLEVNDPWQKAEGIHFTYRLSNKPGGGQKNTINTPVKKVICLSTTHIGYIAALEEEASVKGISGKDFVYNRNLREKIRQGNLPDVGYEQNLNYEKILEIDPDVVLGYSISSNTISYLNKLKELEIPVVLIGEYLENHPLGKSEWIKVLGILYDKYGDAVDRFEEIEQSYNRQLQILKQDKQNPSVIIGLPWKDKWFVPGGNSFLARFVMDAGGYYLWQENSLRRSYPLEMEKIYRKGHEADIWIHPGNAHEKEFIRKQDSRLASFKAFQENNIFNNNKRVNEYGGNDYWESGVVNPDVILKDMIKIFHPELLPDHALYYYINLE